MVEWFGSVLGSSGSQRSPSRPTLTDDPDTAQSRDDLASRATSLHREFWATCVG